MADFPNDEDGLALMKMQDVGIDMSKPVEFDFYAYAHDETAAKKITEHLHSSSVGDRVKLYREESDAEDVVANSLENAESLPPWTICIRISMIPTYSRVVDFQRQLLSLVAPFGGGTDGWGILTGQD